MSPGRAVLLDQFLGVPPAHVDKLQRRQYFLPFDTRHLLQVLLGRTDV